MNDTKSLFELVEESGIQYHMYENITSKALAEGVVCRKVVEMLNSM